MTATKRGFRQVETRADFPAMERERQRWWYESGVVEQYLHKNDVIWKQITEKGTLSPNR